MKPEHCLYGSWSPVEEAPTFIRNVFGRHIGAKREGARWLVFRVDLMECKFSRLYDIIIPDEIPEEAIPGWPDDLSYKAATIRYPGVQHVG